MTVEEAIKHLKLIVDNEAYADHFQDVCRTAIEALEKQIDAETEECSSDIDLGKDKTIVSQSKLFELINKLAEYEDLEEQGLLLRLPCKVGDTLYIIEPRFYNYEKHEGVQKGICKGYELNDRYGWVVKVELEKGEKHTLYFYNFSKFGKTAFLTREEAEQKLKELEENV